MTKPDPSTQPISPAPDPIGDFTKPSFWRSPSSYLLIASHLIPIFVVLFPTYDFSAIDKGISLLAPILAYAATLVMRGLHTNTLIRANAALAMQRLAAQHELTMTAIADVKPENVPFHNPYVPDPPTAPNQPQTTAMPPESEVTYVQPTPAPAAEPAVTVIPVRLAISG